jgi:hypothetical protein
LGQIGDVAGEFFAGPVAERGGLARGWSLGAEVAEEDLMRVDFPEPFGPRMARIWPGSRERETSLEGGFVGGVGEGEVFGLEDGTHRAGSQIKHEGTGTKANSFDAQFELRGDFSRCAAGVAWWKNGPPIPFSFFESSW